MDRPLHSAPISRRSLFKAGGGALAAATIASQLGVRTAAGQAMGA